MTQRTIPKVEETIGGDIFKVMKAATSAMRDAGCPDESVLEMHRQVLKAHTPDEASERIGEYVEFENLELEYPDEDTQGCKPAAQGYDGNIYSILGAATKALKRAGFHPDIARGDARTGEDQRRLRPGPGHGHGLRGPGVTVNPGMPGQPK